MQTTSQRSPGTDARTGDEEARPAVRVRSFSWHELPIHVYLQSSSSFLMGARRVGTVLGTERFPRFYTSPMGMALWLEVPGATAGIANGPPDERVCAGLVMLNVHFGHPRFAALRAAMNRKHELRPRAFQAFAQKLAAVSLGQLTETQADALATDLIEHALRLTHCESIGIDERVRAALHFSDMQQNFRITEIAKALNISATRLSHLFTAHTGFSFRRYVTISRTLRAWELVALSPQLSLTEIAHGLDFADLAHMSRAFREIFFVTPSQFREPGRYVYRGSPAAQGQRITVRWPASPPAVPPCCGSGESAACPYPSGPSSS